MKHKIKHLTAILLLLTAVFTLFPTSSFADESEEDPFDYWLGQWRESGYPDDIGDFYVNQDTYKTELSVVDPSPERIAELREIFGKDLVVTPCKYSYNELYRVHREIENLMMTDEPKIYSVGMGWRDRDDPLNVPLRPGFGASGYEMRTCVWVDENKYEYYSGKFAELYGDKVYLVISEPFVPFDDWSEDGEDSGAGGFGNTLLIALITAGVCLLVVISLLLRRRQKKIGDTELREEDNDNLGD